MKCCTVCRKIKPLEGGKTYGAGDWLCEDCCTAKIFIKK
jgi:hypothetical protein